MLIQGGMGVAVSGWRLARAVARTGQMGVVSGTALDSVLVRRLQLGDPGGDIRRAMAAFPIPEAAEAVLERYFIPGGKSPDQPFAKSSMNRDRPSARIEDLLVVANFVEVWLAKEGSTGPVGVNYLEKLQAPTLPSLYGAMLAGVDYVLMGAGIPRAIPAILNRLAEGLPVDMKLDVKGATRDDDFRAVFDPSRAMRGTPGTLHRPDFLAIVSSHVLAIMLATKIDVPVDGFIIEGHTAGGHNAPPRGKLQLNPAGEPVYGDRDRPDLEVMVDLGLPFWMAGGWARPERVREALELGASGVQVGTPFAYCEESDFDEDVKRRVLKSSAEGHARVFTDPVASPSGFPFKVVETPGTLSDTDVYEQRTRTCTLGYLRHAYRTPEGRMAWRCPAEPVEEYLRKGGALEDTVGRKCLCQALMANVGLPQLQPDGTPEPLLITSGDAVSEVARFLAPGADTYTAAEVVEHLLGRH